MSTPQTTDQKNPEMQKAVPICLPAWDDYPLTFTIFLLFLAEPDGLTKPMNGSKEPTSEKTNQ